LAYDYFLLSELAGELRDVIFVVVDVREKPKLDAQGGSNLNDGNAAD
jgi:hypothetical protein